MRKSLTNELKAYKDRLLNRAAAVDLLLEEEGELPTAKKASPKKKANGKRKITTLSRVLSELRFGEKSAPGKVAKAIDNSYGPGEEFLVKDLAKVVKMDSVATSHACRRLMQLGFVSSTKRQGGYQKS